MVERNTAGSYELKIHTSLSARLTLDVAPLPVASNDDIGMTEPLPIILRTLRVARSELVYTRRILHEKYSKRIGKAPTTADAEEEQDV